MKSHKKRGILAVRLYVDDHDLPHWEIYERATGKVLSRVRAAPKPGKHGRTQLSATLKLLQDIN